MRLALVSDIHGNLPALESVLADIQRRGADAVVNLGDSLSGPLMPLETAQFLMAQDWLHLAGNHERQLLDKRPSMHGASDAYAHSQLTAKEFAWIASLKPSAWYAPGIFLCHGTPTSDVAYFLETVEPTHVRAATVTEVGARLGDIHAELIACGHTHVPRSMRASRGSLIVNPGSVGLPAYDDSRPFPHVVASGSPDARYALLDRTDKGWTASLISVPHDFREVEKLALARNRKDWAFALRYGAMA